MTFSHDVEASLSAVVALVNTDPASGGDEQLPDLAALRLFIDNHLFSDIDALAATDLRAVRALRTQFREVFFSTTTEAAAALLNELLQEASVSPRLTDHDGYGWHIHYYAPGSTAAEHLLVDGGMALSFVITANEPERLQVCAAPDCQRVLVDLSRNRSKRYCDSRTCGNRLHVAAYRERQRASAS